MKKDSPYIWYIIDSIIFALINITIWINFPEQLSQTLSTLSWTILIILSLGIWRLTDIITQENVTDFLRVPFGDSKEGLKGFFATLFSCNSCMGVWVAMLVFYLFTLFPIPTLAFMVIMTLTCFERFLSKIYNLLEKRG